MKANAEGIKTLTGHSELIVAAPLGDLTDDEFRKTLIQEGVKLAGSEGQVFVKKHNLTLMFWVKFRKTVERLSEFHADEFESCSAYGIRAVSEYNGLASSFFEFLLHEPCKLNCREETCCRMLQNAADICKSSRNPHDPCQVERPTGSGQQCRGGPLHRPAGG